MRTWNALQRSAALVLVLFGTCASTPPVQIVDAPNQPPAWDDGIGDMEPVRARRQLFLRIRARDPESDPLTFTVSYLPEGASLRWVPEEVRRESDHSLVRFWMPEISWTPTESQAGSYEILVTATDGKSTITRTIRVVVEEEWETFLMPGVDYALYAPVARSTYGMFHGPAFELLIAGWVHRNENRGPSHVRIYAGTALLASTESDKKKGVQINFGFNLSIERNPTRRALIPYFGMETGVLIQSDFGKPGYFAPLLGINLWADRNLFVTLSGGYLFPTAKVDDLRGYYGKLGVNFSLW